MKRLTILLLAVSLLFGCQRSKPQDSPNGAPQPEVVIRFATKTNPGNKVWVAGDLVRRELERRRGRSGNEHRSTGTSLAVARYAETIVATIERIHANAVAA